MGDSFLLRYGSLAFLVAQDTALVLLMRSSRDGHADRPMYLASSAVCCMEVLKLSVCALMLLRNSNYNVPAWRRVVRNEVLEPWGMAKLAVPAVLYLLQNNLLYFALSHLRATPYKVTYNLKILTGAFFSTAMLGQRLGPRKWAALVALMAGVSVVQLTKHEQASPATAAAVGHAAAKGSVEDVAAAVAGAAELDSGEQVMGFVAVFAAAVTSGFCGVYQQRILQRGGTNIWVRNAQMGASSVPFAVVSVLVKDLSAVTRDGFFQGYCPLVWGVILLQAFGGLNVAFILKHADNILKGFAAAFSTVASCLMEVMFYGFKPTGSFLLGALLINTAAYIYNTSPGKSKKKAAAAAAAAAPDTKSGAAPPSAGKLPV